MMDYKKYLKTALVGDGKMITYRQLSRELKVHVNVAKEMLHDFHHDLNFRKPSSCHATYILSGIRRTLDSPSWPATNEGAKDVEGDEVMGSSPFELSQASSVGNRNGGGDRGVGGKGKEFVRSIVLVGEERLEEVKASFEVLSAIHVYSIEPSPLSVCFLWLGVCLSVVKADMETGYRICFSSRITA
ncbi:DNA polymerase subunit Cdc27-domain-containing protein, partial [Terfezia claveryi]